ncbi:MAG: ArsR/SmtB family transcription factor [Candidatus Heimdallarchaeota archaeon]
MPQAEISLSIPENLQQEIQSKGGLEKILMNVPSLEQIEQESRTFKALADPLRLQILHILRQQAMCVCLIKEITGEADSKLSYHFSVLKDANLIRGEYEKNWIIYRLTNLGEKVLEPWSE